MAPAPELLDFPCKGSRVPEEENQIFRLPLATLELLQCNLSVVELAVVAAAAVGVAGRVQSRDNHAIGTLADVLQTGVTWAYQKSVSSDNRSMRRELRGSMDRRWGERLSRGWWASLVSSGCRSCCWRWTSLICRGCRGCWASTHCSLHPSALLSTPEFNSAMKLLLTTCFYRQSADPLHR